MSMDAQILISVCVCTYKRCAGLRELLETLARQEGIKDACEVIVVDNDAAQSAKQAVDDFQGRPGHLPVRYFVKPLQNIALARKPFSG